MRRYKEGQPPYIIVKSKGWMFLSESNSREEALAEAQLFRSYGVDVKIITYDQWERFIDNEVYKNNIQVEYDEYIRLTRTMFDKIRICFANIKEKYFKNNFKKVLTLFLSSFNI